MSLKFCIRSRVFFMLKASGSGAMWLILSVNILDSFSGVPKDFVRRGSTNSVEDSENGDLGVVAP